MIISASTIIGDKVKNNDDEDMGKIEELMIDTASNDVNYAVISFGGFLGMGEKLFAVPLDILRVDTNEKCMRLDMSKEQLENAPGFDKDHWPSHLDSDWYAGVKSFYGGGQHAI